MIWKIIIFISCLFELVTRDHGPCTNVSHSNSQLPAKKLRSTRAFYIYIAIYKPFYDFIRILTMSTATAR